MKAVFFLIKGLSQRKRLSKSTLASEEAAVKSCGLSVALVPCIIILLVILLVTFILLEMKTLTWAVIVGLNIAFLSYWIYGMEKARVEEHENGYVNSTPPIAPKRTVSSKMIYA